MTPPILITERPWYRVTQWIVAISALVAFVYFTARLRGWGGGEPTRLHSVLLMGSTTALLFSQLALFRRNALALALQAVAATLLVWSIAVLGTGR
jgi:hypothetical protein